MTVVAGLRFELLGPLRAWRGDAEIDLGSPQQRATLAVLLLREGRSASVDELVRAVWSEEPPRTAVATVRTYIYRLRRALDADGPGGPDGPAPAGSALVSWSGGGYALAVGTTRVDLDDFRRLVTEAAVARQAGDAAGATELLRSALALWRDEPLAGLPSSYLDHQRTRLTELRLDALERRLDLDLELGRHAEVASELPILIAEQPLRERFRELLMLALHRSGRQAQALAVFGDARRELVDQLGVEPGAALRDLQQRILRDDPDLRLPATATPEPAARGTAVPAQLPGDVFAFTGRDDDLEALDRLLARESSEPAGPVRRPPGSAIVVLSGPAGVGKTALAVHWSHRAAGRFSDGQLYVNLLGHAHDPPLRPIDALARFLRALGTPPEQVPDNVEEAAGMYRSLLARRRVLVLLDNAHTADQVRPLLPGGPGCGVLVTSRNALGGLVAAHGARSLPVEVLDPADSLALLADLLGADLSPTEVDAAAELAGLCDHLPLALRIVAATMQASPQVSIADQVRRLRAGDRLAELAVEGDDRATVRAAYDLSYSALPGGAQRLFRLFGLAPGTDAAVEAIAALIGVGREETVRDLRRLAASHLLVEVSAGRYGCHDLLRLYAAQRARAEDPEPQRSAAIDRLLCHYLARAGAAAQRLNPAHPRLPGPADDPAPAPFADPATASGWLDDERANLLAAIDHAARLGPHAAAWRLTDALRGYFFLRRDGIAARAAAEAGLRAARSAADQRGQAAMRLSLAWLAWTQGRNGAGTDEATAAIERSRAGGWPEGEAAALVVLGNLRRATGDLITAGEHLRAAVAIEERLGRPGGAAVRRAELGAVAFELGELAEAERLYASTLAVQREIGARSGQLVTVLNLCGVHVALGRLDPAVAGLAEARRLSRSAGDRGAEVAIASYAGFLRYLGGDHAGAAATARSALAAARDLGDPTYQAWVLNLTARCAIALGDAGAAVTASEEALRLADGTGDRYQHIESLIRLAVARGLLGDDQAAATDARAAVAEARAGQYAVLEGQARTALAETHLLAGRYDAAVQAARDAAENHRRTGHLPGAAQTELVLARAYAGLGRADLAHCHADRARTAVDEMGVPVPDRERASR